MGGTDSRDSTPEGQETDALNSSAAFSSGVINIEEQKTIMEANAASRSLFRVTSLQCGSVYSPRPLRNSIKTLGG